MRVEALRYRDHEFAERFRKPRLFRELMNPPVYMVGRLQMFEMYDVRSLGTIPMVIAGITP